MEGISEKLITTVVSVIASAIVGAVVSHIVTKRSDKKKRLAELEKRQTALEEGTKALLRAEIIRSYDKYTDRCWIPLYAREALDKAYEAYKGLGGNGAMSHLYEEVARLPNRKNEEEEGDKK